MRLSDRDGSSQRSIDLGSGWAGTVAVLGVGVLILIAAAVAAAARVLTAVLPSVVAGITVLVQTALALLAGVVVLVVCIELAARRSERRHTIEERRQRRYVLEVDVPDDEHVVHQRAAGRALGPPRARVLPPATTRREETR